MRSDTTSPRYFALLIIIGVFILGPLAGISAAFMNFKLGFFLGGSVLAGVLGSTIALFYGKEGRHGANYIQTLASALGSFGGMSTILQVMHWLEIPPPADWKMILLFLCTGMFGVGIGRLYTPLLVDKWQLQFPSGKAVANILTALTDRELLKRSVAKLGGGAGVGGVFGLHWIPIPGSWFFSAAVVGAGLIVGARIAVPALVLALVGLLCEPLLLSIGWLQEGQQFRHIGLFIALAMILGAAIVHIVPIIKVGISRFREAGEEKLEFDRGGLRWVALWGCLLLITAAATLQLNPLYILLAMILTMGFALINGISVGISDANPVSAAFVVTVLILVLFGVESIMLALVCSSIVLIGTGMGVDMQQDRSTGWRLGSNRKIQFWFQVIGIAIGAPFAVGIAHFFFNAYPELMTEMTPKQMAESGWSSAMTFKLAGILKGIGNYQAHQLHALLLGLTLGIVIELLRRKLRKTDGDRRYFSENPKLDFAIDAIILPSPFAAAFGGFVPFLMMVWYATGGIVSTVYLTLRSDTEEEGELPAHMGAPSLVGGGIIAGEALGAVAVGIYALLSTL